MGGWLGVAEDMLGWRCDVGCIGWLGLVPVVSKLVAWVRRVVMQVWAWVVLGKRG